VVKVGAASSCELQLASTAVVSLAMLSLALGKVRVELGLDLGTLICKVNALVTGERFQVKT